MARLRAALVRSNGANTTDYRKPASCPWWRNSAMISAMPIRLVMADDSYIIREGVRELARGLDDIEVVAACSDFDTLKEAIEREHPDVVLTDIRMPPTNTDEGIRMADSLRSTHPEIGVVVLSQYVRAAASRMDPSAHTIVLSGTTDHHRIRTATGTGHARSCRCHSVRLRRSRNERY